MALHILFYFYFLFLTCTHVCVSVGFVSLHHVEVKGSSAESVLLHGGSRAHSQICMAALPARSSHWPLTLRYRIRLSG